MHYLLTGSEGLLGSYFRDFYSDQNLTALNREKLDITDTAAVSSLFEQAQPDIVIHTAAWTDVEGCEKDPELCFKINTDATKSISDKCKEYGSKLIFISSTGLYGDWKSDPYIESDEPKPTTTHHQSKHEAEKYIQAKVEDHLIIRTGWLFGGAKEQRKNFVFNRYKECQQKDTLQSNAIQRGCPTFARDLVVQVDKIISSNRQGVYNVVNNGSASRFEYVKEIVNYFQLSNKVETVSKDHFKRLAQVSDNEVAINHRLEIEGLNIMPSWKNSLQEYIEKLSRS